MGRPETEADCARQIAVGTDLSLRHLEAALARIDVLLRREVKRWQLAGQDPSDAFRGLYVSDDQADALLSRPLGTNWGHAANPHWAEADAFAQAERQASLRAESLAEAARCQGHTVSLEHLRNAFGLEPFEVGILLVCLAPALDLRYERLYGYLQDDVTKKRPSVNLVLDLLCQPGPDRLNKLVYFARDAPLFRYHLLDYGKEAGGSQPLLLSQALEVDQTIVAWLLGSYRPDSDMGEHASLSRPEQGDVDALLVGAMTEREAPGGQEPIVVLCGPDEACQRAAARLLAARAGRALLSVDLAAMVEAGASPLRAFRLALRDARLVGAVPFLAGWDACLDDGTPPANLLRELCAHPGLAIVAGHARWQPKGIDRKRKLLWLEFPIPTYPQRRALWEHYLAGEISESNQTSEFYEVPALASQFQLTTSQIRDAVTTARDLSAQEGKPLGSEHLFAAARAHSNPRLSSLARQIVPRYGWDDIILPDDQLALLREIVATVRGRPQVLDEWGLGQKLVSSRGVTALFSGPPGTGKTMAAEILAAELRLDLYKIDLSTVVSKYIGETEKNLERIFNEAEQSNAILFFDEADALFGKRSEVRDSHDRYANIEISYLLQRMEMYDGVTILATNLRANLDEAFTRRLQFAVDFPFPEAEDRLRIWHTLFPPDVPSAPALDLDFLAQRFRLAGGNIRNVLVSAAYLAASDGRCMTMEHLLHGIRRELQKMGRLVDAEDLIPGRGLG